MGSFDRRTYLELLAAGGIAVPSGFDLEVSTAAASGNGNTNENANPDPVRNRVRRGSLQPTVTVSIQETNTPVRAGDVLEVTARLYNRGDTTVTRDVFLEIGDDRDRVDSATVTIDADAGETVELAYETYPVEQDVVFPVAVTTDESTVSRPVGVYAGDGPGVTRVRPAEEVSVQPGTTVMFEVASPTLTGSGSTEWRLDGEHAALSMGPWYAEYFYSQGADYWQHTFESAGTHEVTAVVGNRSEDVETRETSWTVDVASNGIAAPTVEATRPEDETLTPRSGETTTLELDVADPDGHLDRVVWWMNQADVILDVTDVGGSADTASFSTDGDSLRCHTCGIVAWVLDEHGAIESVNPWLIDDLREGRLTPSIVETNDPVHAGDVLEVTVELANEGRETASQDVFLEVADDRVDDASVTIDAGETETVTLSYETYPVEQTVTFDVIVSTEDASTQQTVEVIGTEEADEVLAVSILETNDPVGAGDVLEVTARLENGGNAAVTEDVTLVVSDDEVDRTSVTVGAGETETVVLRYETYPVEQDVSFPVAVVAGDESAERVVEVHATEEADDPTLSVTIVDTNDPVTAGERLEVTAQLENEGASSVSQTVSLAAGDDRVDSTSVTVGGGETETVVLGYETYPVEQDVSFSVTVSSEDDSDQRTVEVLATEEADDPTLSVTIVDANDPVDAGDRLEVTARLENDGSSSVSQTITLVVGGEQVASAAATVGGGGTQTITLGYETYPVEQDVSFPVTVSSEDDSDQRTVTVYGAG